jgi:hypothetical protein
MLAVVESMRHWRHYLEGSRHAVQVFSDHKNLKPFMSTKVLNRRQARWAELLAGYDFVLIHIPGTKNPADEPSRRLDLWAGRARSYRLSPPYSFQSSLSDVIAQRYRETPSLSWSLSSDALLLRNGLVYIPESLRVDVIRQHHDSPLNGHQGVARTCESFIARPTLRKLYFHNPS